MKRDAAKSQSPLDAFDCAMITGGLRRYPAIPKSAFARAEEVAVKAFTVFVICLGVTFALTVARVVTLPHADAATSVWGDYEGAVKGAFMRSEGEAFTAVTHAIEDLPEIARDGFVKGVIVGLGLASTAPDTLEAGNIKPESQQRLRDALSGFANADELIAEIEKRGVAKPIEVVDDSTEAPAIEPVADAEPVEGNKGVVRVVPREAIEPVEAVQP